MYTKQIPRGYSKPPPTQCFTSSPSALFNFDNRVEKNIFKRLTLLGKKLSYNLHIIIWDSFIVFCCDICRNLSKGYVWWQNKYNHHQMTRLATTHSQMCNKQKILLKERQKKNIFKIMTAFVVLVGEFRLNCRDKRKVMVKRGGGGGGYHEFSWDLSQGGDQCVHNPKIGPTGGRGFLSREISYK